MNDQIEKRRVWINIYRSLNGACGSAYDSAALAEQWAGRGRIACIEVQYQPGEGLNAREQRNRQS